MYALNILYIPAKLSFMPQKRREMQLSLNELQNVKCKTNVVIKVASGDFIYNKIICPKEYI